MTDSYGSRSLSVRTGTGSGYPLSPNASGSSGGGSGVPQRVLGRSGSSGGRAAKRSAPGGAQGSGGSGKSSSGCKRKNGSSACQMRALASGPLFAYRSMQISTASWRGPAGTRNGSIPAAIKTSRKSGSQRGRRVSTAKYLALASSVTISAPRCSARSASTADAPDARPAADPRSGSSHGCSPHPGR